MTPETVYHEYKPWYTVCRGCHTENKTDKSYLAERLPFWPHLSVPEKQELITHTVPASYRRGTNLQTGRENCIGMLIVRSGQLTVHMLSPRGRDITLFRIGKDDVCVLSASCVLDAVMFEVNIEAEDDTELLVLGSPAYRRLSEQNIYVKEFSYELSVHRFSEVMWTMQQILFMSFDRRLAVYLTGELDRQQGNPVLRLTHEQIARHTGSAREVVTRMLNYFEQEGIVALSRGSITVTDIPKLKKTAAD
jgi:CRP/FNR family transcriptional regulator, anaerobic regulatory protein